MAAALLGCAESAAWAASPDSRPPLPRAAVERLCAPVDVAALVVFRIAFGTIMLAEIGKNVDYGWNPYDCIQPSGR